MAVYRDTETGQVVERRSSGGAIFLGIVVVLAVIVGLLFATGFWSAKVRDPGELPSVAVKASGGALPDVDLNSKKVVVGTKQTSVDVPVVNTKKEAIDVPVVGVKP
ncbi:MAG: hypothetical protein KGN34_08150 [Sphingomonadales bacterium]|nr:hypothetical protein [Sphingomonadales bacterium]